MLGALHDTMMLMAKVTIRKKTEKNGDDDEMIKMMIEWWR